MFNWFKSKLPIPEEKWGLVRTIELELHITDTEHKGIVYYHLFESENKKRKVDIILSASISKYVSQERCKELDIYQKRIYRWLNGRHDPEIPRYEDIAEEDVVNELKGKVS